MFLSRCSGRRVSAPIMASLCISAACVVLALVSGVARAQEPVDPMLDGAGQAGGADAGGAEAGTSSTPVTSALDADSLYPAGDESKKQRAAERMAAQLSPEAKQANAQAEAQAKALQAAEAASAIGDLRTRLEAPGLTVAGGVSLGSYGGGFLYYYTLLRHQLAGGKPFAVVTGASAGSINSLLAALAMCAKPSWRPEQNLFFDTWVPVGMTGRGGVPGLRDERAVTSRALFSRKPIEYRADELGRIFSSSRLDQWSDQECETMLGLLATQLIPQRVSLQEVKPTSSVSRQMQKFLIKLSRRKGEQPKVTPDVSLVPRGLRDLYPILGHTKLAGGAPSDSSDPIEFSLLAELLKASSSFPLAFEPVRVPLTRFNAVSGLWEHACDNEAPGAPCRDPEFVDGGVFENVPLNLAQRVLTAWKPGAAGTIVVDTESTPWQRPEQAQEENRQLLNYVSNLAGSVLTSTMAAELFTAFDRAPELRAASSSVAFTVRQLPTASGHFFNFLGFFDCDFRVFDFYLGMLDAKAFVGHTGPLPVPNGFSEDWKVMRCFEAWYEASNAFTNYPGPHSLPACNDLKVGTWNAANRKWDADKGNTDLSTAQQRTRFNVVRLLAAAQRFREHEQAQANLGIVEETDVWFDLLQEQGISKLNDVSEAELSDVRLLVRDQLFDLLDALASKQRGGTGALLRLGVRTMANYVYYREPLFSLSLGLHALRGMEAGLGFSGRHMRVEGNLRLANINPRDDHEPGVDLRAGPRLVWAAGRFTGALSQIEPFAGCGYYGVLRPDGRSHSIAPEFGLYGVLIQHLYGSFSVSWRHRLWKEDGYNYDRYTKNDDSWSVFGSVGWRFLWGTAR